MPEYALSGTEVGPRRARILGACALAVVTLFTLGARILPDSAPADRITVVLLVGQVGEGVGAGTDVRLDGVRVGAVRGIDFAGQGRRKLELSLLRSQLFGLSDSLAVDFAPANLFGVSAIELHTGTGGAALSDGSVVDLTGAGADRLRDATLAALLNSTGELTRGVLTPQLAQLLSKFARDLDAFTPLLQAIGTTARSYADTRELPPSVLFERSGAALAGVAPMLTGSLTLLYASYNNGYLRDEEHIAKFAQLWPGVQNELLPVVTQLFGTAEPYFSGLLPIVTVVLDRVTGSVSDPVRSAGELRELLRRLDAAFRAGPDGPVLRTQVELDPVPGLSAPLAAGLGGLPTAGGDR
ncbi:MlaD family protein [Nocardia inohanensis]|uniref:MlaD family protein n=1 Tax=Nocardia inohanensis TaxID=209246 RepID=UPI0008357886|nr:MlaD family protein [Nocardia inohanensis]